jgi:spermidine synthase
MIPWTRRASAQAPDGTEISLWQHGKDFVVRAGPHELMSTRWHGSEEVLAEQGCAGLGPGSTVMIGGLGLGFTLRAALAALPAQARVVVVELIPEVVEWLREPVGGKTLLEDARVVVEVRDVVTAIRKARDRFDAILLDVDNGPGAVSQASNGWLYTQPGLRAAARALRAHGRLAVWSAGDDAAFPRELRRAGFEAKTLRVRAHRAGPGGHGQGARHVVFLGVRG